MSIWSYTALAAVINVIGTVFELSIGRSIPGIINWPALLSGGVGLVIFLILISGKNKISSKMCSILFVINSFSIAGSLFITQPYYAALGPKWVPFQANKLGCMIIALLAPSLWSGSVSILITSGLAVLRFYLFSPEIRNNMAVGEPLVTIAFAVVGGLLLWFRITRAKSESKLLKAQSEIIVTKRFAKTFLLLRDMTNTPLQTLEFSVELLKKENPGSNEVIGRVSRALSQLKKIDGILTKSEALIQWETKDLSVKMEVPSGVEPD